MLEVKIAHPQLGSFTYKVTFESIHDFLQNNCDDDIETPDHYRNVFSNLLRKLKNTTFKALNGDGTFTSVTLMDDFLPLCLIEVRCITD